MIILVARSTGRVQTPNGEDTANQDEASLDIVVGFSLQVVNRKVDGLKDVG